MICLVYMAYPDGCQHEFTFLPRQRPYPGKGALALGFLQQCDCHTCDMMEAQEMQATDDINGANVAALRAVKSCSLAKNCCLCHGKSY